MLFNSFIFLYFLGFVLALGTKAKAEERMQSQASPPFFVSSLALPHNFREGLAQLFLRRVGGVAKGDKGDRLFVSREGKQFFVKRRVEVAHPAGGKALCRGSEAEMLYGDGNINVPVPLAVRTHPFLVVAEGGDDIHGCRLEPLPVIALLHLRAFIFAADNLKPPGLLVAGGGCETHTFEDVVQFLLFHAGGLICPAAVSVFYEFQEIHILIHSVYCGCTS